MPKVTLKINGEIVYENNYPMITIGRTSDNNVPLPDDTNISRYHARIEQRKDGYWLVDQGSSNGSAVNGASVETEMLLESGDVLLFGGSSEITFETDEEKEDENSETAATPETSKTEAAAAEPAKSSSLMLVAGAVVGLAVISVVTAGIIFWNSGSKCEATARIKSPDSGEMLSEATDIELEVTNPQCVQRVIYLLNGEEIASSSSEPFTVSLDPQQFSDLADGLNHSLQVVLVDGKGEKIVQKDEVLLAFETLATPTPTPEVTQTPTGQQTPRGAQSKTVSAIETQEMVKRLLKQFTGGANYKLDAEFLLEVSKKTPEYIAEGYFAKAQQYRDVVNVAYVTENNLDVPLGYILAMSRSKFNLQKQGVNEGLWQMSNEFLTTNGLNVMCGTELLGDASQNCAAKSSALYLKGIILNVFEGDIIYGVAAFGMSPQEAAEWKATLPANRVDFWKIIKSPKQREEIIRFFAAGIVAENPQRFGLKKDRPISEIYRNLVGN